MATPPISDTITVSNAQQGAKRFSIVLRSAEQKVKADFNAGDDISDSNKKTLNTYVATNTKETGNAFPIKDSNGEGTSTRDAAGNQAPLKADNEGGQSSYLQTFRDSGSTQAVQIFEKSSNTGILDNETPFHVKKLAIQVNYPSSHELMRDVDRNLDNSDLSKRVINMLENNALYSPANKMVPDDLKTDDDITLVSIKENGYGTHAPRKYPNTVSSTANEFLKIHELKKVALSSMLLATGELVSPAALNDTNQPLDLAAKISTLAPGLARSGIKVPVSRFSAASALREFKPEYTRDNSNLIEGKTTYSYGNVNSPFVPFAGATAASSIVNATTLIGIVGGLLKSFKLFDLVEKNINTDVRDPKKVRQNYMGSFRGMPKTTKSIQIVDIEHDFYDCLNTGLSVFFDTTDITAVNALGNATSRVSKIHGYYNVVLRNVVRSLYELVNPGSAISSAIDGATDVSSVVGAANPVSILERLNSSTALKFVNMLLTIGDKTLNILDQKPNGAGSLGEFLGQLNNETFTSDIDSIVDTFSVRYGQNTVTVNNPAILQSKGRLSNGQTAIGNSTVRSLILMPQSMLGTARALDNERPFLRTVAELKRNNFVVAEQDKLERSGNRISQEIVEQVENYLEADYAPFYFHDLRTNEIISLHAFISDISEQLSVDYGNTESYGRIGSVNVYKNTKRSLSLKFSILATSDEDFDEMWFKINKIAMMCYPQWTQGRIVSYGNNKFIQPFSQLPGASPMIRLRVGDLIKGNYSKLNVARMFGLSGDTGPGQNSTFNLESLPQTPQDPASAVANAQRVISQINLVLNRQQARNYEVGDIVKIRGTVARNSYPKVVPATSIGRGSIAGNNPTGNAVSLDRRNGLTSIVDIKGRVVRVDSDNSVVVTGITMLNDQPVSVNRGTGRASRMETISTNDQYMIPIGSLVPDAELAEKQINGIAAESTAIGNGLTQEQQGQTNVNNSQTVQAFFNDGPNASNPIMRAFASTKGRGMPGFIKEMSMDYSNATWVTFRHNSRAPLLVNISINFEPTYDIQPGLDHNGFMTAPVWNVGKHIGSINNARSELEQQMNSLNTAAQSLRSSR